MFESTIGFVKRIPGAHWIILGLGPHRILFSAIDISLVSLLLTVVYELHIAPSLTTAVFCLAVMVFMFFYPLLTWKQYWEILENGIVPLSYAVYFFYTLVFFLIIGRPEFLYTLFEGDDTALLSLFQPLSGIIFETHPPLPEIDRISYIRSRLNIILVFIGALFMWNLRISVLYDTVAQELEKVGNQSNMNPEDIGYE